MAREIAFSNINGSFVFREDGTLLGNGTEQEMLRKFPDAQPAPESAFPKIMGFFRQESFKSKFVDGNKELTRSQIAASVNEDNFIIQAIASIEELQKTANTHAKRLREWYGLFAPEVSESMPEHEEFSTKALSKTPEELLEELGIKNSMGTYDEESFKAARELASLVISQHEMMRTGTQYLESVMKAYCPNILAVAGGLIAGKLLAQTGSLKRLSQLPSSTVQILGAEKALFRHLRNRMAKPPKHGFIISHPIIMRAKKQERGKAARQLADKISIAARVDYFKGKFVGDSLRNELEARFK